MDKLSNKIYVTIAKLLKEQIVIGQIVDLEFKKGVKNVIKSGISQIGGKFRLKKELLELTPRHEFFLSLFSGSCIYELNKPRCRYECFNDKDTEIINYLLTIRKYPKEFEEYKKNVFGLVSQDICNKISDGTIVPENNIERAYYFYYLNKLTFNNGKSYKGLQPDGLQVRETDVKRAKASYKGLNPNTTRPYTNNDRGLLTAIDPKAIERLRYVNLTCYDFRKAYDLFYRAFYKKKGLTQECYIYIDPPYPGTENYYGNKFRENDHHELIDKIIDSPFHINMSIGGNCDFYLDVLLDAGWKSKEVHTRYPTSANTQDLITEHVLMNYDIEKVPKMIMNNQPNLMKFVEA